MSNKMTFKSVETDCVLAITDKAVLIESDKHEDGQIWIPRSTLSSGTDDDLRDGSMIGEPMELKIHTWFTDKEGL